MLCKKFGYDDVKNKKRKEEKLCRCRKVEIKHNFFDGN